MENLNWYYAVIFLGIILIVIEMLLGAATGFDLLLLGIILIIAGGVGFATQSIVVVMLVITVLSILYVLIGRRFIRSKLSVTTQHTNVEAVIGHTGTVLKSIQPQAAGQVKVSGEIWRAESDSQIAEGTEIIVKSVSGVTLFVMPKL